MFQFNVITCIALVFTSSIVFAEANVESIEFYSHKQRIIKDIKKHCYVNHTSNDEKWIDYVSTLKNNKALITSAVNNLKKNNNSAYSKNIKSIECPARPPV